MAISKKDVNKATTRINNSTKDLSNTQKEEFMRKSMTIDKSTLQKIETFRKDKGLDFSSAVRFICNDYFKSHN
jgi:hypothetical protein